MCHLVSFQLNIVDFDEMMFHKHSVTVSVCLCFGDMSDLCHWIDYSRILKGVLNHFCFWFFLFFFFSFYQSPSKSVGKV